MSRPHRPRTPLAWFLLFVIAGGAVTAQTPQITVMQRAQVRQMLRTVREAVREKYYDPAFHGLNVAEHFKAAEKKLETVESMGRGYAIIAQALIDFGDSHTFFIPPQVTAEYEYGWQMAMVGDQCLVVAVKPGSDAEAKGLRAGDRILEVEAFPPNRTDLWKMRYSLHVLNPRRRVRLVAQTGGAPPRPLEVETKVTPGPKQIRVNIESLIEGIPTDLDERSVKRVNRAAQIDTVAVWRIEDFGFPPDEVDRQFDAVVKGATDLVIDVRGNPGGYLKTLEQLVGRLFDRDVKIADMKMRKSTKASTAKARKTPFKGRIVVLVDSESGSAAEILARVLQLEERAKVLGDRSAGSVMVSEMLSSGIPQLTAAEEISILPFGFSITVADYIMKDGKSLERTGVIPDEVLLPSQADLAAGLDPVLARAISLLGAAVDPAAAGKLFPLVWR